MAISPNEISGLELWLDSADLNTITKNGSDVVSEWRDKSGNGYDFDIATATPTWVDGDGVQFTGGGENIRASVSPPTWTQAPASDMTLLVVGRFDTSYPTNGFILGANASAAFSAGIGVFTTNVVTTACRVYSEGGGSKPQANFNATNVGFPELNQSGYLIWTWDQATLSAQDAQGDTDSAAAFNQARIAPGTAALGARDGGGSLSCQCTVFEVLTYDRVLTEGEIAQLRDYVLVKWGLPAPGESYLTGGDVEVKDGWRYHTVSFDEELQFVDIDGDIVGLEYLGVAGGGAAGQSGAQAALGGGAAGGVLIGSADVSGDIDIEVGAGGVASGVSGTAGGDGEDTVVGALGTADGGGGGGVSSAVTGRDGGSGGGGGSSDASGNPAGGSALGSQGEDGGVAQGAAFPDRAGGGGGGAGEVGGAATSGNAGDGGDGVEWPPGSGDWWGGGGGGGANEGGGAGEGGRGGGGDGGAGVPAKPGQAGKGGGAGGAGGTGAFSITPQDGGSGVAKVRYLNNPATMPPIGNIEAVPRRFQLGCADEYTVIITARDLETYAAQVNFSGLTWSRVLDEISDASVQVPDVFGGLRCNIELGSSIVPWRFGLRIERNSELVWTGPITQIERPVIDGIGAEYVTITAQDKMAWMTKRTPLNTLEFDDVDAGSVFRSLIVEGTDVDNLFGLFCPVINTGYSLTRDVIPLDFEYIYDILDDLARSAVDWFVIGNELAVQNQTPDGYPAGWYVVRDGAQELLAPTSDTYGRYIFGMFIDGAWVNRPGYVIDGLSQANNIFVPGADSGEAGFRRYWTASDVDAQDGVLTYVDVNALYRPQEGTPITADAAFQERADTILALRGNPPVIISGGVLGERAPIEIGYMFPGSLWAIDLGDHGISQLVDVQRLKRVDVSVQVTDSGVLEQVTPTLIPLGTDESEGG